jgi:hypothetical protein
MLAFNGPGEKSAPPQARLVPVRANTVINAEIQPIGVRQPRRWVRLCMLCNLFVKKGGVVDGAGDMGESGDEEDNPNGYMNSVPGG